MKFYKNLSLENLEGEEWRQVIEYEGLYQVSSLGRVKSLKDNNDKSREKILRQVKLKNGYLKVNLWKNGKIKNCTVHRLVANAFIPNPSGFRCVNHRNEDKTDNCIGNLEWCDQKYNVNFGSVIKRRVANIDYKARTENTDYKARTAKMDYKVKVANTDYKAIAEKLSKQVYQYDKNGVLIAIYQSASEAGRNGFDQGTVSKCCNGKLNYYKGFIWSYEELNNC